MPLSAYIPHSGIRNKGKYETIYLNTIDDKTICFIYIGTRSVVNRILFYA